MSRKQRNPNRPAQSGPDAGEQQEGPTGRPLLMTFVKNPVPGRVKTRLAQTTGNDFAADIYRRLLRHTREVASSAGIPVQVWYSDRIEPDDLWGDVGFPKRLQRGDHLGQRLESAFEDAFAEGYVPVIVIGSDCPGIRAWHIEQAMQQLRNYDLVLGPSQDGGYYLLGLNRPAADLFREMPWSKDGLLEETVRSAERLGLNPAYLEPLNDIDTEEDLDSLNALPGQKEEGR